MSTPKPTPRPKLTVVAPETGTEPDAPAGEGTNTGEAAGAEANTVNPEVPWVKPNAD